MPAPRGLARRHEDDHLALVADTERVDRVGQARPEQCRDPHALEETPHDDRLRLIAPAHLDQAALTARGVRALRKRDHLSAWRHGSEYNPAYNRAVSGTAGIVVACPCGEVYEVRPEYAGRLLECPSCRRHLRAGQTPSAWRAPAPGVDAAFDRDVFLLRERIFTITSKYEVWAEAGTPILYVERPTYPIRTLAAYIGAILATPTVTGWLVPPFPGDGGGLLILLAFPLAAFVFLVVSMSLRPLRHVTIYRDESRKEPLLRVLQDQRVALLVRTYTITMAAGAPLAKLRKTYLHNIVRKRWYVTSPDGA